VFRAVLLLRRVSRLRPGPGTIVHGLGLVRLVGSGGCGEVWLATPRGVPDAEHVALKFPNIARLMRLHLDDDVPCIEFEFVAGGDLHALVKGWYERGEALEPLDALRLLLQLARGRALTSDLPPSVVSPTMRPRGSRGLPSSAAKLRSTRQTAHRLLFFEVGVLDFIVATAALATGGRAGARLGSKTLQERIRDSVRACSVAARAAAARFVRVPLTPEGRAAVLADLEY